MKTNRWLFLLVFSLYLSSCGESHHLRTLQTIDSIADTHPDSAMSLLQQFKDSIRNAPEETQMFYHLLCIKAQDKAYIPHTSDSLITQILRYYRNKKDKRRLPIAYYYAGRVYRDLEDTPQALMYFHRAIASSEKSVNYKLMNKIYSQIGTLYLYQDIYEEALETFKKAHHYSTLIKDSISIIYDLRDIGRSFTTLKHQDSAIYYYEKADELAKSIGNLQLREIINSELAGYYTNLGKYEEAYKAIQIALLQPRTQIPPPLHSTLANYYKHTNQLDSAEYYYSQLLPINNYLYKQGGYWGLYSIAKARGETEKIFAFLNQYLAYTDSVLSMSRTEAVSKANALYNYQLKQKENKKLKIESFRKKRLNVFLSIASVFLLVTFIAYREYYKRKEQAKRIQLEKYKKIQEEKYKSSLAQIEENKQEINLLEISLQEAIAAKDELRQALLKAQKEYIEKNNEQIEAKQKMETQNKISLKSTEIYKKFQCAAKEELTEENKIKDADWQELACAVDKAYRQFTQRLNELHPIKEIELQVCLLLKIGLSPLQIATITIRSKQAITSIRKRLYQKFFHEAGSTDQWDNFIQDF